MNFQEIAAALVGVARHADYRVRLATDGGDLDAAQRLRFAVFNLELNEGLAGAAETGRDHDAFDPVCDHLIVEHAPTATVVGTYRMQTGLCAAQHHGYYCAGEFDLGAFDSVRGQVLELGRACVHREHRNLAVIHLLWRGVARYASERGARYLIGCSSLTSQDETFGAAMYRRLAPDFSADARWRIEPLSAVRCALDVASPGECPPPPKLLRAYLAIGAKICGPPAIDREFGTIDFLTLLDLPDVPAAVREHFFRLG